MSVSASQNVRLVVDNCRSADISELEDGSHPEFDDSSCQAQGTIPPFNEYLNINSPLQIGGRYVQDFDPTHYHWQYAPYGKGFDGCIKNVYHNSKVTIGRPGRREVAAFRVRLFHRCACRFSSTIWPTPV